MRPNTVKLAQNDPESSTTWPADLAGLGTRCKYDRGQLLCEHHQYSGQLHLILAGKVLRERLNVNGVRTIIDIHGHGDMVGITGLLDGKVEPCDIRAHTPTTVVSIDYSKVKNLLFSSPETLSLLHTQIARRIRHDTARASSLANDRVEARIRRMFVDLGKRFGAEGDVRGLQLNLGLTRAQFAAIAGTTLETVVRTINSLRQKGLVATDGRRFFIPDLDRLHPASR